LGPEPGKDFVSPRNGRVYRSWQDGKAANEPNRARRRGGGCAARRDAGIAFLVERHRTLADLTAIVKDERVS
jgi:hypothetical protein